MTRRGRARLRSAAPRPQLGARRARRLQGCHRPRVQCGPQLGGNTAALRGLLQGSGRNVLQLGPRILSTCIRTCRRRLAEPLARTPGPTFCLFIYWY
jgi:hypothetical protein